MPSALLSFIVRILILISVNLTCLHSTGVLVGDNVNVLDNKDIFLTAFDYGESYASPTSTPTSSSSEATLVFIPERIHPFERRTAEEDQINFAVPPFAGRCLLAQDRRSNGYTVDSTMALHRLQTASQAYRDLLHHMQPPMAYGFGQDICSWDEEPQTPTVGARALSHLVARTQRLAMGPTSTQVSQIQEESSPQCQEFEATWTRASDTDAYDAWTSHAQCCDGTHGSDDGMEHAAGADDATISSDGAATASATTADSTSRDSAQSSANTDGISGGAKLCHASDAQDAANAGNGVCRSRFDDDAATGCSGVAATYPEACQRIGTQRWSERWSQSHQRSTGCSKEPWTSPESLRGLHLGKVPASHQLEEVSLRCCEFVAGLCHPICRAREEAAGSGGGCKGDLHDSKGDVCKGARGSRSSAGDTIRRRIWRCSQCPIQCCSQDHREHEWPLTVSAKSADTSCGDRCRGEATSGKAAAHGTCHSRRSHARRGKQHKSWWAKYFFWPGWLLVTTEYCNREPLSAACSLPPDLLVAKWSHSITCEPTFLTEWGAVERARSLAFEIGTYDGVFDSLHSSCVKHSRRPSNTEKRVRFSGDLDVRVNADGCDFIQFTVPCRALKGVLLQGHPSDLQRDMWLYAQMTHDTDIGYDIASGQVTASIMDGFTHFPQVPHDPGEHDAAGHRGGQDHHGQPPDFTDNMIAAINPSWRTSTSIIENGIQVRTWYIHHELHVLHDLPRIVHLPADRSQWIQLMSSAWDDFILLDTPTAFTLPVPALERGPADQFIDLDVIISQGLHAQRLSGLVTVYHIDEADGLDSKTTAASFPPFVSGHHILDAANARQVCAHPGGRVCHIFHGWNAILVDGHAQHRMRPGHSFMVQIPRDPNLDNPSLNAADETESSVAAHGLPSGSMEDHFDAGQGDHDNEPPDDDEPSSMSHPDGHDAPLFNCHFYRLRHPPIHMFMKNAAGVPMLIELARNLNVVPASLLQAHTILAPMVGDCRDDFSFIIQSTTDLPAASYDALVIIDVELHFHITVTGMQPLPATTRRVHRVPRHLAGSGVLHLAGVRQYCEWQNDACLVEYNNVLWDARHPAAKVMRHGTYLRVVVPPPAQEMNTLQAIHAAEHPVSSRVVTAAPAQAGDMPAPTPSPPAPPPLTSRPRAMSPSEYWSDQLSAIYDEEAMIEFEDEGKILYVWTWFIHHDHHKKCDVPRIVKLDSFRHLWRQDILAPWQELIRPDDSIAIAIVGHRPPHATAVLATVHLMIEQQPREARAAGVVSAVFHGQHEDRLLQAAYSLPRWLCVEDIVDILEINHICETQVCTALSGVAFFERFIRHDIPTAISIELHVRQPNCQVDQGAASSSDPFQMRRLMPASANSLMQRSTLLERRPDHAVHGLMLMQLQRRWHRNRNDPDNNRATVPSDHVADEYHQIPQRIAACATSPAPQLPLMAPMWPTD